MSSPHSQFPSFSPFCDLSQLDKLPVPQTQSPHNLDNVALWWLRSIPASSPSILFSEFSFFSSLLDSFLLGYSSHNEIHYVKVYDSLAFCAFTVPWNQYHYLTPEEFHQTPFPAKGKNQKITKPIPISVLSQFLLPPSSWQPLMCCFYGFACSGHFMSMELYTMCLLWLASFSEHNVSGFLHAVTHMRIHSSLWRSNSPLYGWTTFCSFTLLLMTLGLFPLFGSCD